MLVPAFGGPHDAFIDVASANEPAEVLADLPKDPSQLAWMGTQAAHWARGTFAPARYARLVVTKLWPGLAA